MLDDLLYENEYIQQVHYTMLMIKNNENGKYEYGMTM